MNDNDEVQSDSITAAINEKTGTPELVKLKKEPTIVEDPTESKQSASKVDTPTLTKVGEDSGLILLPALPVLTSNELGNLSQITRRAFARICEMLSSSNYFSTYSVHNFTSYNNIEYCTILVNRKKTKAFVDLLFKENYNKHDSRLISLEKYVGVNYPETGNSLFVTIAHKDYFRGEKRLVKLIFQEVIGNFTTMLHGYTGYAEIFFRYAHHAGLQLQEDGVKFDLKLGGETKASWLLTNDTYMLDECLGINKGMNNIAYGLRDPNELFTRMAEGKFMTLEAAGLDENFNNALSNPSKPMAEFQKFVISKFKKDFTSFPLTFKDRITEFHKGILKDFGFENEYLRLMDAHFKDILLGERLESARVSLDISPAQFNAAVDKIRQANPCTDDGLLFLSRNSVTLPLFISKHLD